MVCSSGVSFDPVVNGTAYTFDVAGLYKGLFVMSDRLTGSIWTHYDGTVLQGPLANTGTRLSIQPLVHTLWADWLEQYPDSLVTERVPEFLDRYPQIEPGQRGLSGNFMETLRSLDDRLPENELVIGVDNNRSAIAYVLSDLPTGPAALAIELGGLDIVVFADASLSFGLAYSAVVDGETLEFDVVDGRYVDATDSVWDQTGAAVSGPLAGTQLEYVTSFVTEWYGWAAYHADTAIG